MHNKNQRSAAIISMYHHVGIDILLDITNCTELHRSATVIQTCFRGYKCRKYFKHRFVCGWAQLLRLVDPEDLYMIEPYELVRQEWKNDVDAWIVSMQRPNSQDTLDEIGQECIDGYWGEKKKYEH